MTERLPGVRAIGLDPGSKRIGVAISDLSGTIANPFTVIERSRSRQHDLDRIAQLARAEQADVIVIGLPLNMDGSMSRSAKAATAMAKQLTNVVDVPVELHDERRTTAQADGDMFNAGMNGVQRRKVVDKVAASLMLQAWLDTRRNRLRREGAR